MNSNQVEIQNNLKSLKPTSAGKNGGLKTHGIEDDNNGDNKGYKKPIRLRLKELENYNAQLENLIKVQNTKLIEVTETNTHFIAIIAHDLRSPFNAIIGILDVLKESLNDFSIDEIKEFVNIASNSANRTLNLVDNLLAWTISQNKGKSFNPIKINLSQLLLCEMESFILPAKQKQISLKHHIAPDLNASADFEMVKTILRNLISNAIKFTNTGGEIFINAFEDKNYVEIAVKDNGIGIPIQAQKELFRPGMNISTFGTGNEPGTGLGLLLCKEFVDIHCGRIWVESKPGYGSTFKFTLPHYL